MITEDLLRTILSDQAKGIRTIRYTERQIKIDPDSKRVLVISGVRRCGKSVLLRQLNRDKAFVAVNFEDPRLDGFDVNDFFKIEKIAWDLGCKTILLDEIQNVKGWERYVRSAHDRGVELQITGSNAGMLSRELGTHLTGRYRQLELFPFSYSEFLDYTLQQEGAGTFIKYLESGGFPEYLAERDPEYLRTLLRDIIMRDIALRRKIRNENYLLKLAVYILSNTGKEFSYNKLSNILEIKSVRTTIDFCDYLQESYLIEMIPRFSYSIKQQIANPKKVYCVDTALSRASSLSFAPDSGRMLENAVFSELRRHFKEISYFRNDRFECDFLIKDGTKINQVIQVCQTINENNISRETQGLKQAMKETGCNRGLILTLDQEDLLENISLIPVWKWIRSLY